MLAILPVMMYNGNMNNEYEFRVGDCAEMLGRYRESAALILTSPPYDDLRAYGGHTFDFEGVADACVASLVQGGVLVWVVGDATVDGSETGTSFRQALGFMERGLNLHDTMIYQKSGFAWPSKTRYHQTWEYMFVFSRGKPKTVNLISDRRNKWTERWSSKSTDRMKDGSTKSRERPTKWDENGIRFNIWQYTVGRGNSAEQTIAHEHPAIFPYALAYDHIRSWTDKGDLVIDPMCGSGTTIRAATDLGRRSVGIDINPEYIDVAQRRMAQASMVF